MNKIHAVLLGFVMSCLVATQAEAGGDCCIFLEGIKGESSFKDCQDCVEVDSWSWGLHKPAVGSSTGGAAARTVFDDFEWTQAVDSSIPKFFEHAATGKLVPEMTLKMYHEGEGQNSPFLTLAFENVLIKSLDLTGGSPSFVDAALALSYDRVKLTYRPQKADGSLDAPLSYGFDVRSNRSSGSAAALAGLMEVANTRLVGENIQFVSGVPEPSTYAMFFGGLLMVLVSLLRRGQTMTPIRMRGR